LRYATGGRFELAATTTSAALSMSSERKLLDSGVINGELHWEASGISPACGFELTARWNGLERIGFSMHPLLLMSPSRRQQVAAELLLPAIAQHVTGEVAIGPDAAVAAIEAATKGTHLEAAQQVAAAWRSARDQHRREENDRAQQRRAVAAPVAA